MNRDMIEQVAAQLQAAAVRLTREVRHGDEHGTIGTARLSALGVLAAGGTMSLSQLADADKVRAPTMSRIVDALVREGLVTRETVPNDRRSVRIAVTQQGREALARERKTRLRHLADRLERLGDSEQRALQRGVELLERVTIKG